MEQNNKNTFKYESDKKNNLLKDMNIKSKPLEILIKICTVLYWIYILIHRQKVI